VTCFLYSSLLRRAVLSAKAIQSRFAKSLSNAAILYVFRVDSISGAHSAWTQLRPVAMFASPAVLTEFYYIRSSIALVVLVVLFS
jgi:hypothetical protein